MTKTPAQWKELEREKLRNFAAHRASTELTQPKFVQPVPAVVDDDDGMPSIAKPEPKPEPKQETICDPETKVVEQAETPKRRRGRPRKNANTNIAQETGGTNSEPATEVSA